VRSDIPVPQLGSRDVLIPVAAAGVNNTDINARTAWHSEEDGANEGARWSGTPI
jgi:NADPH:quinone reductase-like Zn-dependent oxidoreductase